MSRITPSSRVSSLTAASGAQSTTVTIPANASWAVVALHYAPSATPPTSVTLDSQTCTLIDSQNSTTADQVAIYKVSGFSTGASKTFAWTNPSGLFGAVNLSIEYRDGTPTYGAHAVALAASNGGTATTSSLANSAGDEILTAYTCDSATVPTAGAGQSKLDDSFDGTFYRYGFTTEPGTGTSDAQAITGNFPGIASTVISVTGGAVTKYHMDQLRRGGLIG